MKTTIIVKGTENVMWNGGKVEVLDVWDWYDDNHNPKPETLKEKPHRFSAMVRNERGHEFEVDYRDLELLHHIEDLDNEDFKKLRGEVVIGSLYFSDYNNSFNIPTDEVLMWCDDYIDYLFSLCEKGCKDLSIAYEKDSAETFAYFMENRYDLIGCNDDDE